MTRDRRLITVCRTGILAIAVVAVLLPARGVHAAGPRLTPPPLIAQAAFVLDDTTGRALYALNADTLRYPASTIKMLTAIVALQHLRPAAVVTVRADALVGGTSANLAVGERLTVRNLLYGMLIPSGNDAAVTLADAVSGSSWLFASLMNAEARSLHLWRTNAALPDGLDVAGQYSTARDLAWLGHALLHHRLLARIVKTKQYQASSIDGRYRHVWTNLNHLLWTYPGAVGVKTGTTPLAGANLVACAVRGHHRVIVAVLGSTYYGRFTDAGRLFDYAWRLLR